jgi:hypothetical protein
VAKSDDRLETWTLEDTNVTFECSYSLLERLAATAMAGFEISPAGGPEIGGILFGTRTGDHVRILAHRLISCEHAFGPAFELSEQDHATLEKLLQAETEESILVGWYHSEYWNLCLTRQSAEFHERYLPEPWQVALVLHRQKSQPVQMGFFVRERSGMLKGSAPVHELTIDLTQPKPSTPPPEPPARPPSDSSPHHPEADPAAPSNVTVVEEPGAAPLTEPASEAMEAADSAPDPSSSPSAVEVQYEIPFENGLAATASAEPVSNQETELEMQQSPAPPNEAGPPYEIAVETDLPAVSFKADNLDLSPSATAEPEPISSGHPQTPPSAAGGEDIVGQLLSGVQNRRGLMLVTCTPGTEFDLLLALGDALNHQSVAFAMLLDVPSSSREFYQMIAGDMNLRCAGHSKEDYAAAVNDLIWVQESRGSTTVLILDHAQSLSLDVFAELLRLADLSGPSGRMVQTILFGAPELEHRLRSPELLGFLRRV